MYVLGIDGGGTRTTGIVADELGNVYMHAVTGRSNPNTLQQSEFEEVLSGLMKELKKQNDTIFDQLSVCFAGIAGVGESGRDAEVAALLARGLPVGTKVTVRNDAFNALYSGTLGGPGIVQIAGTGAVTLGINEDGEIARSGGWGYLFDDEGSGFYLGNEALKAVFRSFDNRGGGTSLTDRVTEYFAVQNVPDIIAKVYGNEHPRSVVAPLARLVMQEATTNDAVSKWIVEKACKEMMHSIEACHRRLFDENHRTAIILSGGVFTDEKLFISRFRELARHSIPNAIFQTTQVPPVGGAVLAGLAVKQTAINPGFANWMNEQLQEKVTP
ncbi:N-acetylglucosamine kinase [Saccharococcus sp. Marseille-Q5394]|uniref:N-acetylglucosamine kinase n=1 Tax=Saccharococcus sp. Marseille-Q5394 TaxID=2972778 RepID=UPI0021C918AF|nr:BadF/BadG/BcrA/BcrD ATPase family protein [Saccharococcus sp. Marseille-Q5394]